MYVRLFNLIILRTHVSCQQKYSNLCLYHTNVRVIMRTDKKDEVREYDKTIKKAARHP